MNVAAVSDVFVQPLPSSFCHSHVIGPVAFVTTALTTLERDLLKDALAVVKRFKTLLHHRLKLDAL